MNELFDTAHRRRLVFSSAIATIIALASTRFFLIPYITNEPFPSFGEIIILVLDNLLVALISSTILAALVLWLVPPFKKSAAIEVIEPLKIREVLQEARKGTNEWWYRGAIGRHFRSVTLTELAKEARLEKAPKRIYLLLLDPLLVHKYFSLNRSRLTIAEKDRPWTEELMKIEIYATILTTYSYKATEPSLEITVGLLSTLSVHRIDLSSRIAVITSEGSKDSALRCDESSFHYKTYREDLLLSLQQARVLPAHVKGVALEQLSVANVKKILLDLGFESHGMTDKNIEEIISKTRKARNPYG